MHLFHGKLHRFEIIYVTHSPFFSCSLADPGAAEGTFRGEGGRHPDLRVRDPQLQPARPDPVVRGQPDRLPERAAHPHGSQLGGRVDHPLQHLGHRQPEGQAQQGRHLQRHQLGAQRRQDSVARHHRHL